MAAESIIAVENLKTYLYLSRGVAKAVDGVSFEVKKGEILGLVGESGSGKSITCLSIVGLLPTPAKIVAGKIILDGVNLVEQSCKYLRQVRGRKITMILQDPSSSLNPVFTIGDQVAEAVRLKYGYKRDKLWSKVIEWLALMRLPTPKKRLANYPHQLSGGMKQRVVGAIALSVMPKLVIADEPTTALDVTIQAQYLQELKKLQQDFNLAVIFVTHDLGVVATICDRVCVMYAGKIVEQANADELFENGIHPYTTGLLASLPKIDAPMDILPMIPGEPPPILNLPAGCSFAPRCPLSKPRCKRESPPLMEVSEGHLVSCWEKTSGILV